MSSYSFFSAMRRASSAILAISLVLAVVGGYYSVLLYKNLRTDIEELLPASAPSVIDLKKGSARFSSLNHLEVVIESPNPADGKRLQLDIAKELNQLPKDLVSEVKVSVEDERAFFEKYRAYYLPLKDWRAIRDGLRAKVKTAAHSAFDLGLGDDAAPSAKGPPLEETLKRIEKDSARSGSLLERFPDNLFASPDGKTRVVLAIMAGQVTKLEENQRLSRAAEEIIHRLKPETYGPGVRVGLGGDVQNVVEEQRELVKDLILSFIVVAVLVGILLGAYFRSIRAMVLLTATTLIGTFISFGVSYFIVGYLNANTAFLGSIVLGNGINFPIILLARYAELRRNCEAARPAMIRAISDTWKPTLTAALAAGISYLSLALTDFRGFSQFGIMGGLGMVVCWLVSYLTLPAAVRFLERRHLLGLERRRGRSGILAPIAPLVVRHYNLLGGVTLVVAVVAALGFTQISRHTIESDLSKLRNKWSMEHGSGFWGQKTDDIFGQNITPTAVLTDGDESTRKLRESLETVVRREEAAGRPSPFASIGTVDDIYPGDQREKYALMGEIRGMLNPSLLAKLNPQQRDLVTKFLPNPLPKPFAREDLPFALLRSFRENNGRIGTILHVYPRLAKAGQADAGTWNGDEVIRYTALLREAIRESGQNAVIVGQNPVSADMLEAINKDGPIATACALVAVALLVIVLFPRPREFFLILTSLGIGVLWMGGLIGWLHWKINFLNFIALPITFGIGVDYAVNMFGRLFSDEKKKGQADVAQVIRETGGAVVLCSCTTVIGYGSLLLSGSQAFVSFGRLAVSGELACVIAAVLSLPSLWIWTHRFCRKTSASAATK